MVAFAGGSITFLFLMGLYLVMLATDHPLPRLSSVSLYCAYGQCYLFLTHTTAYPALTQKEAATSSTGGAKSTRFARLMLQKGMKSSSAPFSGSQYHQETRRVANW
jgi:hypothetical protein